MELYFVKRRDKYLDISNKQDVRSDFVPFFLGLQHISREDIVEKHTTDYATQIFNHFLSDSVISIMDGTYIYIQKAENMHSNAVVLLCISIGLW